MQIQDIEYIRSNRIVICHVYAAWRGDQHRFTGVSICHPIDRFDFQLGKEIAVSRAMNSLASKMYRVTKGQVDMLDHNAFQKHRTVADWEAEKNRVIAPVNIAPNVNQRLVPRHVDVINA